jgi:hypothetical protein
MRGSCSILRALPCNRVPRSAAGSLVFLPQDCGKVLSTIYQQHGSKVLKRHGFADAFHPGSGWVNDDVIGIDLGITLLMAENYRNQSVWKQFMQSLEAKRGFDLAGFATDNSDKKSGAPALGITRRLGCIQQP